MSETNPAIVVTGGKLSTVRATLETNRLAPLHLAQALAPLLKRSRVGRIVNMSSGMGRAFGHGRRLRGLSHLQSGIERSHRNSCRRIARRGCGQLHVPALGQDGYGRRE